jgi:hypothetical protein
MQRSVISYGLPSLRRKEGNVRVYRWNQSPYYPVREQCTSDLSQSALLDATKDKGRKQDRELSSVAVGGERSRADLPTEAAVLHTHDEEKLLRSIPMHLARERKGEMSSVKAGRDSRPGRKLPRSTFHAFHERDPDGSRSVRASEPSQSYTRLSCGILYKPKSTKEVGTRLRVESRLKGRCLPSRSAGILAEDRRRELLLVVGPVGSQKHGVRGGVD